MLPAQSIQFESIGHTDLEWCAPLPAGQPDGWFDALETKPPKTVVDLGCGTGAFVRAWSCGNRGRTIGVDHSPQCINVAKYRSRGLGQWVVDDAATWAHQNRNMSDLTVCIGVEDLGGDFRTMLALVDNTTRRGKWALVGVTVRSDEEVWQHAPELATQIPTVSEFMNAVRVVGWRPVVVDQTAPSKWTRHDQIWRQNIRSWLRKNPDNPNTPEFRDRLRRGRDLFNALGPNALSFLTVLARV